MKTKSTESADLTDTRLKGGEFTWVAAVTGILLAVVFGAANAYLGLRVGLTVSASIPAAVISMGVLRVLLRRHSVLENNMVQTIGSAGEAVAAGSIFTLPALFMWAREGVGTTPEIVPITFIALAGGLLGALFMVPLRHSLIVEEEGKLVFPEGRACADVLQAGENAKAGPVFVGMGAAMLMKAITDGIKLVPAKLSFVFDKFRGEVGLEASPALAGVGYIVGPKVSALLFAGSLLGWMMLVPLLSETSPAAAELYATGGAEAVWRTYVRYIGAGAIATGGFISLIKSMPVIGRTFRLMFRGMCGGGERKDRIDRDIPMRYVVAGVLVLITVIALSPSIKAGFLGASLIALFGFFFATVSARMVGLVGSSNNPVSGMTIATLLVATLVLKTCGNAGAAGMLAAMTIGAVTCVVASLAGDTAQDLKTGRLVGATPWKQELGLLLGTVAAALAIGGVLYLLNEAWGFGGKELSAPQASVMKNVVEGVMNGNMPWTLVGTGVVLAIMLQLFGVPVMPVAIGLYLPIHINGGILVGGVLRQLVGNRGTLYSAGLIAGEGLAGIALAICVVCGVAIPGSSLFGSAGGLVLLLAFVASYFWFRRKGPDDPTF